MSAQTTILRRTAAGLSISAAIAAGGYAATTTFGPDAYAQSSAAHSEYVLPSPEVQREYVETIQALYGPSRAPANAKHGCER